MADTGYLRQVVESYVRSVLEQQHGSVFRSAVLALSAGGGHEFDAVSEDGRVIAAIKTAGGRTSSGGYPAGKVRDCEAELYYLTQVQATLKLLVLTSPEFFGLLNRRLAGRLDPSIRLALVELPTGIEREVAAIRKRASAEMRGVSG